MKITEIIQDIYATLTGHVENEANPHAVTKAQVGLGNVDNTADVDKPVSTAQQAALDLKADDADLTAHVNNEANPHGLILGSAAPTFVSSEGAINALNFSEPVTQAEGEALRDECAKLAQDLAAIRAAIITAGINSA